MNKESRNDEIEVLRALAVMLVVFSHLRFLFSWRDFEAFAWLSERYTFWTGVDLFFCISGFVIARNLLPKLEDSVGSRFWSETVAFWIRRWYRIVPSAWLWIAVLLFLTLLFRKSGTYGHFQINAIDGLSAFLNIANFHYAECVVSGTSVCGSSPLGVYWSLSLEEQFYFLLPLLIAILRKRLAVFCLLMVCLQFFIERNPADSYLWFLRTDAIYLGVLLAVFHQSKAAEIMRPTGLGNFSLRWLIFIVLIFSLGAVPAQRMVFFSTGIVALVSAALVFISSYNSGYLMKDGLLRKILVWIGGRSFAIYLIHWPVFLLIAELWKVWLSNGMYSGEYFAFIFHVFGFLLVFGISELNFRLVENRFRIKGRKVAEDFLNRAS